MSKPVRFVEAKVLVNAYSLHCGTRKVRFDPERIAKVIDVYYRLHPNTRLLYDRAYEVRFDSRYPICSHVVVGPGGLMNRLQDLASDSQTPKPTQSC